MRLRWCWIGALVSALWSLTPARVWADGLPPICGPQVFERASEPCAPYGPGEYVARLGRAGVPLPLPPLRLVRALPYRGLTPEAYAHILTATAPVYASPYAALAGWEPTRRFEKGFEYVSLLARVTVLGQTFYQINSGEFMRAGDLEDVEPSAFQGQFFSAPPAAPIGWAIQNVQPSAAPGLAPDEALAGIGRYQFIQIYSVERVGDWDWYLVGPGQWVEQRALALTSPTPPPGAPDPVIVVDTYEQTLGVYQGGGLIFSTLVSSGSRYFPTRSGTFHIWGRVDATNMSGAYFSDRRDYYFLEDVPWTMFYDGDRALHGAYWHDHFGIRGSHGCVNLSPRDARWLFNYASVGMTVMIVSSGG